MFIIATAVVVVTIMIIASLIMLVCLFVEVVKNLIITIDDCDHNAWWMKRIHNNECLEYNNYQVESKLMLQVA